MSASPLLAFPGRLYLMAPRFPWLHLSDCQPLQNISTHGTPATRRPVKPKPPHSTYTPQGGWHPTAPLAGRFRIEQPSSLIRSNPQPVSFLIAKRFPLNQTCSQSKSQRQFSASGKGFQRHRFRMKWGSAPLKPTKREGFCKPSPQDIVFSSFALLPPLPLLSYPVDPAKLEYL